MLVHATPPRKPSTRQKILLLLKRRSSISVQEISEHLGLTGTAIRRHLYALQKDRYVQTSILRQHIGRPTFVYRLTVFAEQLFPNQYDVLAMELIHEINDMFGDSLLGKLFEQRMKKLEQKYRVAMSGQCFEARVTALAKIQDDEGYMVRLEKYEDGTYLFEEANCPISQVATLYHQACQCEITLFAALLYAHVERTKCIADGETRCRYLITERRKTNGPEGNEPI